MQDFRKNIIQRGIKKTNRQAEKLGTTFANQEFTQEKPAAKLQRQDYRLDLIKAKLTANLKEKEPL